jgi:cytoskeleton protein RodZ
VAQGQSAGSEATAEEAASAPDTQAAADNAASATPMPAPLATGAAPSSAPAVTAMAAAPKAAATLGASTPAVVAGASAATATPAAGQSIVALSVKQDSWFSVRGKDGKEVFSGLVHAGDTKEVTGEAPFKVTVGNRAGLDSLTLDGQPVDPAKYAAAKGNVARVARP